MCLNVNGGASGYLCQTHFGNRVYRATASSSQGSLQSEQYFQIWPIAKQRPLRQLALSTVGVVASESQKQEWPGPRTSNLSLPELSLFIAYPNQQVGPGSRFLSTGLWHLLWGITVGLGAACLPDTGWVKDGGRFHQVSEMNPAPGFVHQFLPRPSEQRHSAVLTEPSAKASPRLGKGGDSRSECEVSVCDFKVLHVDLTVRSLVEKSRL